MSPSDGMRAELNTLRAERDELLKALEPFARLPIYEDFDPLKSLPFAAFEYFVLSESIRKARQAIQNAEGK